MTRSPSIHGLLALVFLTIGAGCTEDLPQDPAPDDRVRPIYDSTTGVIPIPNVAALDDDGTLPRRDGAGNDTAQGEFYRWFADVPGWPTSTPITVPFDGLLDSETVTTETFRLGELVEGSWMDVAARPVYSEGDCGEGCESVVTMVPEVELQNGRQYAVAVTRAVTDPSGNPIGEPTAFFYAMSPEPLVDESGNPTLALFADDPETASALEGLRVATSPYLSAASAVVDRDDLALVFGWPTRFSPGVSFDTETSRFPTPNDLLLDADGTFPRAALEFCGDDAPTSCAQGDFDSYLDGLHGWPTSTPINFPWDPIEGVVIDESTIDEETIQLWRIDTDPPQQLERDVVIGENSIGLTPAAPIEPGARYVAVISRDVEFTRGEESYALLPDPLTALAVQRNEVADFSPQLEACGEVCGPGAVCAAGACVPQASDCEACGAGQACVASECVDVVCADSLVSEVTDCEAEQIEEARLGLAPVVEAVDDLGGIRYDDIAGLTAWTAITDTFVEFDIAAGRIPFPSTFLTAGCPPERPICGLYDPDATDSTGLLLNALSERSGFSTFATNFIPLSGLPIDESTIAPTSSVRFAQIPGLLPELLEADEFSARVEAGHILVDFAKPLAPETLSVGVITTEALGSNGHPVQPSATFALIRNAQPLVDENGVSQVSAIDDATAQALEPARQALKTLFDNAAVLGLSRATIASAWPYTTGTSTRSVQELRARTHELLGAGPIVATAPNPDVVTTPTTLEDPNFPGVQVSFENVGAIHRAVEFETVNWVSPGGLLDAADTTREQVGVTIYVPEDLSPTPNQGCEAPYDVAIVQHGLGSWRGAPAFAMADAFAQRCIAVVAMDLPLHGGRTPAAGSLHPTTRPDGSGDAFLTADLLLSVQHYKQAVVDLSILTRVIQEGGFDGVTGTTFSNSSSQIGYLGVSLGGQIGTAYLGVEPSPVAGVINVAGANLSLYLTESTAFAPLLDQLGVTPGTVEFIQTLHFVQWTSDPIDPFNFAGAVTGDPLAVLTYDSATDEFAESPGQTKDVLVQMVDQDAVAPNRSTRLLADTFGVGLMDSTFFDTTHGFLAYTDPAAADQAQSSCGRQQAVEYLASAFAGTANVPPNLTAETCVSNF